VKIVVGIDGSERSKEALRWTATHLADNEIFALHAYDVELPAPDATPLVPPPDLPGLVTEIHEGAVRLVTAAVEEVAGETNVTARAVEGPPVTVLLEEAAAADLLVVGSHGAGLADVVLGSVSLECVERAKSPVLVHRG
jgi:nucleotide-binding universal stress UspA family protein